MALVVALFFLGDLARAQEQPAPKWEIFGGYSFIYPNARLHAINPIIDANQEGNPRGLGASVTYNFNRWFGLTADFSGTLWGSGETPAQLALLDDAQFYNVSFGPKLTYRREHFAPFVEGLVGWHRLTEDQVPLVGSSNAFGFMLGGGVDVPISRHFALRLLRADFVFSNHQFPPAALVGTTDVRGVRLQTGIVLMFGGERIVTPTGATCSVQPTEVFAGEPVQATATTSGFNPKHTLSYNWTSTGGAISGKDASASVDTKGLNPGSYTVNMHVTDARNAKAMAACNTAFAIRERAKHPPQISCSAYPGTVQSGTPSNVTCTCSTPDSGPEYRPPVSVSIGNWSSSSGKVSGSEGSATLDTAGVGAGPVTVSATCTDNRGLSSNGEANVNVENPPPPLQASKLNECGYTNKAKPARVDNACKAALDDYALRLQRDPDAKGVVVGNRGATEKAKNVAGQRAANVKDYMVKEKGIDPARIETRTGSADAMSTEQWVVPAGATFSEAGTEVVTQTATAETHGTGKKKAAPKKEAQ
ncbi:MAG: outer membrane beta-barrel protein [Acidobacteriia bacterium]|nr:outer membrane beta-barrel protein [Terriglobia bacterium]